MRYGVANQKLIFTLFDTAGAEVTTGTGSAYIIKDGGSATALAAPTYQANTGWIVDTGAAANTQGTNIAVRCTSSATNCMPREKEYSPTPLDPAVATVPANATQFAGQTITCSGGVTIPAATLASTTNITTASGVTLAAATHTGAVIPTVTSVTNAVTISTGTGAGQLDVTSGRIKADTVYWNGSAVAAPATAGYPAVTMKVGVGTGELSIASGVVNANTTQFAGQTVTAASGVTLPSSVASPTNITAGTITTVTNLTNAPTNGDFTATMKTSITTAATAATPTVTISSGTGAGQLLIASGVAAANALQINGVDQTNAVDLGLYITSTGVVVGSYQTGQAPLKPTVAGRTLDVTATGAAGVDWGNVENQTTAVGLTGTTISTSQAVASVSGAVGSVTAAVSVTGDLSATMKTSVAVAVLDATAASYNTAGTIGEKINTAATAGDPWGTALPGAYGAGTAGYILGNMGAAADPWNTAIPGAYAAGTAGYVVGTAIQTALADIQGASFNTINDSLHAIRQRGDVAWTTGAGQTADLIYYPSGEATVVVGTRTGAYTDLTVADGTLVDIQEAAANPGIDLSYPFAAVATDTPAALLLWGYYTGISTHFIYVQAYNYVAAAYETIGTIPNGTAVTLHSFPLTPEHINTSTGAGSVRFLHNAVGGNTGHHLYLDKLGFTATGELGTLAANVIEFGGVAGTFASGRPEVNATHLNGGALSGNNADISIKSLNITNSAGDAVHLESTGNNGHGLRALGYLAGCGVWLQGGAKASPAQGEGVGLVSRGGQATDGAGVLFFSDGGNGLSAISGQGNGIYASTSSSAHNAMMLESQAADGGTVLTLKANTSGAVTLPALVIDHGATGSGVSVTGGVSLGTVTASVTGSVGSVTNAVTISTGTGAGQLDVTSGRVKADTVYLNGADLAGNNATFNLKKINVVNSTGSVLMLDSTGAATAAVEIVARTTGVQGVSVTGGSTANAFSITATGAAASALAITSSNTFGIYASGGNKGLYISNGATLTGTVTYDQTGSITGSVGSVTGAVGSVTGNVGGNVVGSVASVTGDIGGKLLGGGVSVITGTGARVVDASGSNVASAAAVVNVQSAVDTTQAIAQATSDTVDLIYDRVSNLSISSRIQSTLPASMIRATSGDKYVKVDVYLTDVLGAAHDSRDHDGGNYSTTAHFRLNDRVIPTTNNAGLFAFQMTIHNGTDAGATAADWSTAQTIGATALDGNGNTWTNIGWGSFNAATDYAEGDLIRPVNNNAGAFFFELTTDGSGASAEPDWSTGQTVGGTVTDASGNVWTNIDQGPVTANASGFGIVASDDAGVEWPCYADNGGTPLEMIDECAHHGATVRPQRLIRQATGVYYFWMNLDDAEEAGSRHFFFAYFDHARWEPGYSSQTDHKREMRSMVVEAVSDVTAIANDVTRLVKKADAGLLASMLMQCLSLGVLADSSAITPQWVDDVGGGGLTAGDEITLRARWDWAVGEEPPENGGFERVYSINTATLGVLTSTGWTPDVDFTIGNYPNGIPVVALELEMNRPMSSTGMLNLLFASDAQRDIDIRVLVGSNGGLVMAAGGFANDSNMTLDETITATTPLNWLWQPIEPPEVAASLGRMEQSQKLLRAATPNLNLIKTEDSGDGTASTTLPATVQDLLDTTNLNVGTMLEFQRSRFIGFGQVDVSSLGVAFFFDGNQLPVGTEYVLYRRQPDNELDELGRFSSGGWTLTGGGLGLLDEPGNLYMEMAESVVSDPAVEVGRLTFTLNFMRWGRAESLTLAVPSRWVGVGMPGWCLFWDALTKYPVMWGAGPLESVSADENTARLRRIARDIIRLGTMPIYAKVESGKTWKADWVGDNGETLAADQILRVLFFRAVESTYDQITRELYISTDTNIFGTLENGTFTIDSNFLIDYPIDGGGVAGHAVEVGYFAGAGGNILPAGTLTLWQEEDATNDVNGPIYRYRNPEAGPNEYWYPAPGGGASYWDDNTQFGFPYATATMAAGGGGGGGGIVTGYSAGLSPAEQVLQNTNFKLLGNASGHVTVGAYASGQAPLQPTVAGRTLDVTTTGGAGIDWGNVENQATTVNLSNTTVPVTVGNVTVGGYATGMSPSSQILANGYKLATDSSGRALADVKYWNSAPVKTPYTAGVPVVAVNQGTAIGDLLTASGVAAANTLQIGGVDQTTPVDIGYYLDAKVSSRLAPRVAGRNIDLSTLGAVLVGSYGVGAAPLQPTVAGRTLDVTTGGNAGIDWANVESPATTVNLSGTSIANSGTGTVTVGAYAAGMSPAEQVLAGVNKIAADGSGRVTVGGYAAGQTPNELVLANSTYKLATDSAGRIVLGAYDTGLSPREQVLLNPAYPIDTDAQGRTVVGALYGDVHGDITGKVLGGGGGVIIGVGAQVLGSGGVTLAPASTALSSDVWTNVRAGLLDNLNASVGSRAASGEIDALAATVDALTSAVQTLETSVEAIADVVADSVLNQIAVEVRVENGDPVPGFILEISLNGLMVKSGITDGNGDWVTGGLLAGTYQLRGALLGYESISEDIVVSEGGGSIPVLVVPTFVVPSNPDPALTTLYGYARDIGGVDMAGLVIEVSYEGDAPFDIDGVLVNRETKRVKTDDNGYFTVGVLRNVPVRIQCPKVKLDKTTVLTAPAQNWKDL